MQMTPNFRLRKPEGTDPVDVQDLNDNMDVLDTEVAKKMDKTGDASDVVNKFTQAGSRANLTSGEKLSLSLGKIMKIIADLKGVAFSGNYTDLSGKPSIPSGIAASCGVANNDTTTASGFVADARIVKIHGDEIDKVNQNLAGLPTVKAGITELTFSGGNTTLTHNAGFPDTNYAAMFLCDNVRMFPRMSTNIDGNKTTLSASAVNGAGAIANLDGKYRVMWIVARST